MKNVRKNSLLFCFFFCSFLLSKNIALASGDSYYLSITGSDTNNGTSTTTAWATIGYACNHLQAGDTLYVMSGTYTDDSSGHQRCVVTNSGTEGNLIKITAYDSNNKPQLIGIPNAQGIWQGTGITISNESYVEVSNLSITGYYQDVNISNSNNINIDSCDIFGSGHDSTTNPVHFIVLGLDSVINVVINNNKVHEITNGNNLINVTGNQDYPTHDLTFSNNEIYNVSKHNAINFKNSINNPANTYQRNLYDITITGNIIHDVDKGVIDPGSGAIVTNSASIQDSYVANNIVYDSGRGIITTGVNTTFYNNNVYNVTSVAPLGTQQSSTGMMKNCFFDGNNADIILMGGVENSVIRNPLKSIKEYGGSGLIIRDIDLPSLLYWSVHEGNVTVEDTRSKILGAVKSQGTSTYTMSPIKYYTGKSAFDLSTLQDAATGFTITTYPAYITPTSNYLTITPNSLNKDNDTWDMTVTSTVPKNPTTFILETKNNNTIYAIKKDNVDIGTVNTDSAGKLTYLYTVSNGNEFDTNHNFKFISTGQTAPNNPTVYTLTINSGTGTGTYPQGQTITISSNIPPANKIFDKWTGDITYVTNIDSSSTTVTIPSSNISLTATYKDNSSSSSGGSSSGGSSGGNTGGGSGSGGSGSSGSGSSSGSTSTGSGSSTTGGNNTNTNNNTGGTNNSTPTPSTLYPDGTLLKLSSFPRVYVVIQNKKKWISTPEVFTQLGYQWTSIQTIPDTILKQYPDYEDNLIRQKNDYKVYLVVNGVKRHIPNPQIFIDYGFPWEDVVDTDQTVIDKYKDTYLIKESGKEGIYYVNKDGVRKLIPTTDIFNSYGDKMTDVQIVSKLEMESYQISNLIRLNSSNDVYLIQGNIKKHVPSVKVANKYKLNLNQVMSVNQQEFDFYQSGGELR
jgi:hypothetical protein